MQLFFALIPLEHKRTSLEVSADIIEHVDPIFFADPWTAAVKGTGFNLHFRFEE
jgi:ATP-dependent Lon protease